MVQARLMVTNTVPDAESSLLPHWRHCIAVLLQSACPWYSEIFMLYDELKEGMTECECERAGNRPRAEPVPDGLVLPVLSLCGLLSNSVPAGRPITRRRRRQRRSAAKIRS